MVNNFKEIKKNKFALIENFSKFNPRFDFFIGIDSDGTIFDSMIKKHERYFVDPLINEFKLFSISKKVHKIWKHVNIFSKNRGINRFLALVLVFDFIRTLKDKNQKNFTLPNVEPLRNWIKNNSNLSEESLINYFELKNKSKINHIGQKAVKWSMEVNRLILSSKTEFKIFPEAEKALQLLNSFADIAIISNTPLFSLKKDWEGTKIYDTVGIIGGQETGSKATMLKKATQHKYDSKNILYIGDSMSDFKAALEVESFFFPIIPGKENHSWKEFLEEGLVKFISLNFTKSYQINLMKKYNKFLKLEQKRNFIK
mgnify:CR=1 FL=1